MDSKIIGKDWDHGVVLNIRKGIVFSQFAIEDCLFKLVMADLPINNGDFPVRKLLLVGGFKYCFFLLVYGIILPID